MRTTWRLWRLRYWPVVDVRGIRLEIGAHTSPAVQAEILSAGYESAEHTILQSFLRPDDTVMELGTGLGFLAIYCAKRVGSARVFTYEANAELHPHVIGPGPVAEVRSFFTAAGFTVTRAAGNVLAYARPG